MTYELVDLVRAAGPILAGLRQAFIDLHTGTAIIARRTVAGESPGLVEAGSVVAGVVRSSALVDIHGTVGALVACASTVARVGVESAGARAAVSAGLSPTQVDHSVTDRSGVAFWARAFELAAGLVALQVLARPLVLTRLDGAAVHTGKVKLAVSAVEVGRADAGVGVLSIFTPAVHTGVLVAVVKVVASGTALQGRACIPEYSMRHEAWTVETHTRALVNAAVEILTNGQWTV